MSSEGSFILLKCGFHEIWQKIVLFSFSGHPNGPKTTSHNKIVIILFEGLVVLEITALSLNWYLIPIRSCRQKCFACQKTSKKGRFSNFRGGEGSGSWNPKIFLDPFKIDQNLTFEWSTPGKLNRWGTPRPSLSFLGLMNSIFPGCVEEFSQFFNFYQFLMSLNFCNH